MYVPISLSGLFVEPFYLLTNVPTYMPAYQYLAVYQSTYLSIYLSIYLSKKDHQTNKFCRVQGRAKPKEPHLSFEACLVPLCRSPPSFKMAGL
jgi:hypothetical protein